MMTQSTLSRSFRPSKTVVMRTLLPVLLFLSSLSAPAFAASWKAGVAKTPITPSTPMWMSGYAARDRPAEGKRIELWGKALALEDENNTRVVWVVLDLVGIDRGMSERICSAAASRYDLPRDAIALSTTHTHTGPMVGHNLPALVGLNKRQFQLVKQYADQLEAKVIELIGKALSDLEPATIRWGSGSTSFAVNRRENAEQKVPQLRAADQLQGPVDHDVPVLIAERDGGRPLAILCGYACHATVLSDYLWSGDWPGYAQIAIEKNHPGAVALVYAGCGGDQNPLPRRSAELAQRYGQMMAEAVDRVLDGEGSLRPRSISGRLRRDYAEIDLAFQETPTREQLEKTANSKNRHEALRAHVLLDQLDRDGQIADSYPYPVQTWRLGDGPTVVLLGGEVVVDYALRLKQELGRRKTWVAAYTNDVMAYIPSERVLREGGYEGGGAMVYYGQPSAWKTGLEKSILAEVRRQTAGQGR